MPTECHWPGYAKKSGSITEFNGIVYVADQGSHVIRAINNNPNQVTVRFSSSNHNTREEVDAVVAKLKELV